MQLFRTDNSDFTFYFSKHSINRSRKYIVISDVEIPFHNFLHRYIINSDQSIKYYPFHEEILQSEVFIKTQTSEQICRYKLNTEQSLIQIAYATLLHLGHVHTRFPAHQPAYTSVYFILQKTLTAICTFHEANPRIYALLLKQTSVQICKKKKLQNRPDL